MLNAITSFTTKIALDIVGGLSNPSKMPCYSFSIPAQKCITGQKLRDVVGSICSKCYALKGMYGFPAVKEALMRRFEKLSNPQWVAAMIFLINKKEKSGYFRWHDSGDLQSVAHFKQIVSVCEGTPNVIHWIPTREYAIVREFIEQGNVIPENLVLRLSAYMLEGKPPTEIAKRMGVLTSGVSKVGFTCPASTQGNVCGSCRACWDKSVPNVNYKTH